MHESSTDFITTCSETQDLKIKLTLRTQSRKTTKKETEKKKKKNGIHTGKVPMNRIINIVILSEHLKSKTTQLTSKIMKSNNFRVCTSII